LFVYLKPTNTLITSLVTRHTRTNF